MHLVEVHRAVVGGGGLLDDAVDALNGVKRDSGGGRKIGLDRFGLGLGGFLDAIIWRRRRGVVWGVHARRVRRRGIDCSFITGAKKGLDVSTHGLHMREHGAKALFVISLETSGGDVGGVASSHESEKRLVCVGLQSSQYDKASTLAVHYLQQEHWSADPGH